ncbi:MAG TPA: hypothetical protein VFF04_03280 [Candidatus Babeliales bacterium]|nr:hypothetical protein [Candidatus Babeliales bacterium]
MIFALLVVILSFSAGLSASDKEQRIVSLAQSMSCENRLAEYSKHMNKLYLLTQAKPEFLNGRPCRLGDSEDVKALFNLPLPSPLFFKHSNGFACQSQINLAGFRVIPIQDSVLFADSPEEKKLTFTGRTIKLNFKDYGIEIAAKPADKLVTCSFIRYLDA